jgi:glycosyltransferase involved in cell wall biosynthesis
VSTSVSAADQSAAKTAVPSPRVTVVIRTKDRPLFVTRALSSVLAQSYTDWVIVLVNDGGDAAALSAAITAAGLDNRLPAGQFLRLDLPQSIGRSDAFNRGAEAVETEFVCCLDDDDTWDPSFLETLVQLYDQTLPLVPDLGGVACHVIAQREDIVIEDGRETLVPMGVDTLSHAFRRSDFFINPVAYATYRHDLYPVQWMLRRDYTLEVGGFPSVFNVMEDRAFMTRFLQRWRVATLDKKLAYHHRRVRRTGDTARSVQMNTLDNPSYDWRLYADLAKLELNTPPGAASTKALTLGQAGDMIRAAATAIVKELNDETSGLWHKVNGETNALRARIEALDARIGAVEPMQAAVTPDAQREWCLWRAVGGRELGYPLAAQHVFLDRLSLSLQGDQQGLLLYASRAAGKAVVQIPETGDFAALELSLADLGPKHRDKTCELVVSAPEGFLFQTALSVTTRDLVGRKSHHFDTPYVHSCPAGGSVHISRRFTAEEIAQSREPKFSIILPRKATNFRLRIHDLVVAVD